jgi:DNA-binding NarL/FixJ family response regulator
MESELRIVIADDHPIVRQGLRQVIETDPELKVIAEAGDGRRALELIRELRPDIAILDIDMPHLDGFSTARAVIEERLPVTIIFLTIHSEEELFHAALDLGVKGYVLKDTAVDEVINSIRAVAAGRHYTSLPISIEVAQAARPDQLKESLDTLTPTELRILKMLADYQTSKEIAEQLGISVRTVETHRTNISQKLNLRGSHALLKFAVRNKSLI